MGFGGFSMYPFVFPLKGENCSCVPPPLCWYGLVFPAAASGLDIPEFGVDAGFFDQFVVVSRFDDLAVVEDDDSVGVSDGGEAVGDDDHGAVFGQSIHGALDGGFGGVIDGGGGFVED